MWQMTMRTRIPRLFHRRRLQGFQNTRKTSAGHRTRLLDDDVQ